MENLGFGISNKGRLTVIYKGNEYNRHRRTYDGVSYWRCNKHYSLRCKSMLHTKENKVVREPVAHNHIERHYDGQAHRLVNEMKEAMTNPGASTCLTIINGMVQSPEGVQMALPKKSSLVRRLQRAREKGPPATPRNINFEIPNKYAEWVLYDSGVNDLSRIIIFGHHASLQLIAKHDCWLADGTFNVVHDIFFQLYSIHVQLDSSIALPCVLALLPNKTPETYCKFLMAINELVPAANPKKVILDLEIAAMNSFKLIYPDVEISGCYFHLNQSMIRKISSLGLKTLYETDADFAICTKMLCALAILPENEVLEGYFDISELFDTLGYNDNQNIQELLCYFERTYIRGRQLRDGTHQPAVFPIPSWNQSNAAINSVVSTTNAVEGWHYRLQSIFQCAHSTMWKFFDALILEISQQHDYYMHYIDQKDQQKKKYKLLSERVGKIVIKYNTEKRIETLREIAHIVQ